MTHDIEKIDLDSLDPAEKDEYGTILQGNVNNIILQLTAAREVALADIYNVALTLRLSDRIDLVTRLTQFGKELLRIALIDKQRDIINAQIMQRAIQEARNGVPQPTEQTEPKSDVPVEKSESDGPTLDETSKEN